MISIYIVWLFVTGAFLGGIATGALLVLWLQARHEFIEKYYPEIDANSK